MQGKVGLSWLKERKPWLRWNCSLFAHKTSLTSLSVCHYVLKVTQALEYWSFTSEGSLTPWVSIVLKILQSFSLYTVFIFTLSVSSGESSNSILQIGSLRRSERKWPAHGNSSSSRQRWHRLLTSPPIQSCGTPGAKCTCPASTDTDGQFPPAVLSTSRDSIQRSGIISEAGGWFSWNVL